ncbi:MAG TPA: DsbE family thiol:disulfide interchange protein [Caulobacteraceae bacterium]|nr:DsbE family thiol:disulfide interchange protein [Caulobacteraceae bacterium]
MKRWLAFAPLILLVALAALFIGWSLKRDPEFKPDALVGQAVPATLLAPLAGGGPAPLNAQVRGPALVNIFASWCVPCRVEHPELMRLEAEGVRIVGIGWRDKPEASRAFLEELGDPFALALTDYEARSGVDLGISGVPETFAVDARGVIVAKHSGPLTRADAERLVAALRTGAR